MVQINPRSQDEMDMYNLYMNPVDTSVPYINEQDFRNSQQGQINSISNLINQMIQKGASEIRNQYAPMYEQVASEQAAQGRLRSPVSSANFNKVRELQGKSIADTISNLLSKGSELQANTYSQQPQQLLQLAQLGLQSRGQGLQERGTLADLIQRQQQFTEANRQYAQNRSDELDKFNKNMAWDREKTGAMLRSQSEANEKGGWDRAGQAFNMLGNVGQAMSGYSNLRKSFK